MYYLRDEYSQQQIFVWEIERHKGKLTKEAKHKTVDETAAKIDAVHLYGHNKCCKRIYELKEN